MKKFEGMTDEALALLYVKGNNSAFDELLSRTQSKLFTYIMFVVHDHDVADDIFQETFVKAIIKLQNGQYTDSGKFQFWVTRIAHNLIIDYYRQVRSENLQSTDDTDANILNRKELSDITIEDTMVNNQIQSDVRRLIRSLPANQREVLVLRYYKNLSFKEIADITGVSINTALGRMRYAVLNLRRMAEEHDIALRM